MIYDQRDLFLFVEIPEPGVVQIISVLSNRDVIGCVILE